MAHPAIDNQTPFAFAPVFVADEDGRPVVVPVVKATYEIGRAGRLALAEAQMPVNLAGELHGPPGASSWKYEPEIALAKPGTDVVLIGAAHAAARITRELDVSFRLGTLEKTVHVSGDRTWVKRIGGGIGTTDPTPFESIPLVWERAFGGWDRAHAAPEKHVCEPRNPVGTGFRHRRSGFEEGLSLPNLEDPRHLLRSFGDTPPPAGFGFVSPDWQPRAAFAGTYDAAWMRTRMPRLPRDFDRRFFNAAAPGLVSATPLRGDEPVLVRHATAAGELAFRLPRVPAPRCTIASNRRADQHVETRLDTVIVDTGASRLLLLWRGPAPVPAAPHEVSAIVVEAEGIPIHTQ